jgi:5-oxoprolinase (ATP-hydrolysing) subunit C
MSLRVLAPGWHSLLVDLGRPHSRGLGVPIGGAADRFALAIGNALVGNPPEAVALEISLTGPTLAAEASLACVIWGAAFEATRRDAPLLPGYTFNLQTGDVLRFGACRAGVRGYLCVHGGIEAPLVSGSRSALTPLRAGAVLGCSPGKIRSRTVGADWVWNRQPRLLRAIEGGQSSWFQTAEFYEQQFVVQPASNRMGLRLGGRPLTRPDREIVSEPVCPGTVQVTRDGQCIVLGVDSQTIGGYPKIAQVISADIDKLAQLRAGESIRFQRVSQEEAERLYNSKEVEKHEWLVRLRADTTA